MEYEKPVCCISGSSLNQVQSAEKCACLLLDSIGHYAVSANGYEVDE